MLTLAWWLSYKKDNRSSIGNNTGFSFILVHYDWLRELQDAPAWHVDSDFGTKLKR